jgi:hypothetical protein
MRRGVASLLENVTESGVACLLTMVQGNVLALSITHWLVASQTGVLAGTLAAAAVLLIRVRTRWVVAIVLGAVTTVVDYLVHPGNFGPVALEAVITGLGAAALSWTAGAVLKRLRSPVSATAEVAPASAD